MSVHNHAPEEGPDCREWRMPDGALRGACLGWDPLQEHYPGCPCPDCVTIRKARPVTTVIEARYLSGTSLGKTVTATMNYPASGPRVYTGELNDTHHRASGTLITITDDNGPHEVMLNHNDKITITGKDGPQ